jgi:hypothetical protein
MSERADRTPRARVLARPDAGRGQRGAVEAGDQVLMNIDALVTIMWPPPRGMGGEVETR